MRTQLGTFVVPQTLVGQHTWAEYTRADVESARLSGDRQAVADLTASRGVHPDFWAAIQSWMESNPDHPALGSYGYMSEAQMVSLQSQNKVFYFRKNQRYLFGWGLAMEVLISGQEADADASLATLRLYGLQWTKDSDGDICFGVYIHPSYTLSNDVKDVTYLGDREVNDDLSDVGSGNALFYSSLFDKFNSTAEAELNQGIRAFANDTDVYKTVHELVNASMRKLQSLPDGSIAAFYPDRWGKAGAETPIITVPQIELQSLKVQYVESNYVSHVYCSPVTIGGNSLAIRYSIGAVGLESDASAMVSDAVANSTGANYRSKKMSELLKGFMSVPSDQEWQYSPDYLISRYGVRTKTADASGASVIQTSYETREENPQYILPFLLALYTFMDCWSQFKQVTVELTYNPFIWPGCRIEIEGMGLTMFVEKVSHSMSYTGGFTTTITATAPMGSLVDGMVAQ